MGFGMVFRDGSEGLSEVLSEYLGEEIYVFAFSGEGGDCDFEGFDVLVFVGGVFEVVVFGCNRETAN